MELVRNEGDKLTIGGLSFGIGHRIAEEALQGVQVAPVPGYFNGVADCPLHSTWRGTEGFCDLRVQYLGDGVDYIHVVHGNDDRLPQILVDLDVGRDADGVCCHVYGVNTLVFIKLV